MCVRIAHFCSTADTDLMHGVNISGYVFVGFFFFAIKCEKVFSNKNSTSVRAMLILTNQVLCQVQPGPIRSEL